MYNNTLQQIYHLAHPDDHDIRQLCTSTLAVVQEMNRLQGSSNIDETQLPSRGRRERMEEGRVKTRPARVNIQRGEASQGGCNVDRPSSSPRHLYPRSSDEVVTHAFLFTPPPQT